MSVTIGSKPIPIIYINGKEVKEIYLGATKVWGREFDIILDKFTLPTTLTNIVISNQ